MTPARPRRVHRGSVLASGVAIDAEAAGEARARARILSGAEGDVFRVDRWLVVRYRAPRRMVCEEAPGAPLVRYGALCSSGPLAIDEAAALDRGEEVVVIVDGGVASARPLDEHARVDISEWLDVSLFAIRDDVVPLGDPPQPPAPQALPPPSDVRGPLGVAPLGAEGTALLAKLARRAAPSAAAPGRAGSVAALSGLLAALFAALGAVASAFGRGRELPTRGEAAGRALAVTSAPRTRSAFWLKAWALLQHAAGRLLVWTRLAPLVGRQHARYLARMLAMFDADDLDAALRHAIPLSDAVEGALRPPTLAPLAPRSGLEIAPEGGAVTSSASLAPDLFDLLKQKYRRAFDRLVSQGEIEKAAFVLAELLNAAAEAVSFLEQHGRLALAAEIAEARGLPPGLVVRQWFLAGERARAVRFAQRTGAFADAVARLERTHPREAAALRIVWADRLADAGAYAAAVDVVWKAPEARALALAWIDRAIAIGGPTAARMLVRKVRARPESFVEVRDGVRAMLDDAREDGDDDPRAARAIGLELLAGGLHGAVPRDRLRAALVGASPRAACDALLAEAKAKDARDDVAVVVARVDGADLAAPDGEPVRADVIPALADGRHRAPAEVARDEAVEIARPLADAGELAVLDAAELPDGRVLVALGEIGAWLLARDGRVIARFAQPAHHIVLSDHGDRAILLAPRGEAYRLARLDLASKRVRPWRDVRIDCFARDFDGATWLVAREGALFAIDAASSGWEHVWSVDEAGAAVVAIARSPTEIHAVFASQGALDELWTLDAASYAVRSRRALPAGAFSSYVALSASGRLAAWQVDDDTGDHVARVLVGDAWRELARGPQAPEVAPWVDGERSAFAAREGGDMVVRVFDADARRARITVRLAGVDARGVDVRFQGDRMVICDARGRVLVLASSTGRVIREYRLA